VFYQTCPKDTDYHSSSRRLRLVPSISTLKETTGQKPDSRCQMLGAICNTRCHHCVCRVTPHFRNRKVGCSWHHSNVLVARADHASYHDVDTSDKFVPAYWYCRSRLIDGESVCFSSFGCRMRNGLITLYMESRIGVMVKQSHYMLSVGIVRLKDISNANASLTSRLQT
jgi:hypothetical protein